MRYLRCFWTSRRVLSLVALPLALFLALIGSLPAEAHAILIKSDPAKDAVLASSPTQVSMWFTENLNSTFSTAEVVNAANKRVDSNNAHVMASDTKEMVVSLPANLPSNVYVVVWRTQSADDGHVLRGSLRFSVADANGTVPQLNGSTALGTGVLGGATTASTASGHLDGPTLLSLVMITLVDLGVVFWVGAQLWYSFILQLHDDANQDQHHADRRALRRFERFFALPVLVILLLANVGVLIGQGLVIANGQWSQALSLSTLQGLASGSQFGTYWTMRIVVVLIALAIAIFAVVKRERSRVIDGVMSWCNLILALALLIAVALSGHASAVSSNVQVWSVLGDWLHLLAASLWIGGIFYVAVIYLPILRECLPRERTRILFATLARFSPLAIAGVIIMAVTGPLNAIMHMDAFSQLITTAYGRSLLLKALLVVVLLATSAVHVFWLRPRLAKVSDQYDTALHDADVGTINVVEDSDEDELGLSPRRSHVSTASQVKILEAKVERQTHLLGNILRWEPVLGLAILLCAGLLNVFAGTLLPVSAANQTPTQQAPVVKPFHTTVQTKDKQFTLDVTVTPNRFGSNICTVSVLDSKGKPDTQVGVSVYTTMLDMDMGTDAWNLQPDGKGHFSLEVDLNMGGHWQLRVEVRTLQGTLHEGTFVIDTPF
jgi:copper transport protein